MDYKEFNKGFDTSNPEEVIKGIASYLSNEKLFSEQKLFGIRTLLEENALSYQNFLKNQIGNLNLKIEKLKQEPKIEELEKLKEEIKKRGQLIDTLSRDNGNYKSQIAKLQKQEEPPKKKKLIVVRKKVESK